MDDKVNAYTDGTTVYVTCGLMKYLASDNELALVVGHELAHCIMDHTKKKMGNAILGGIIGAVFTVLTGVNVTDLAVSVGQEAFSQEFEAEADYVGCYLAARAGYDVADAAGIWRKLATFHPEAINLQGGTHPSTAKRYLAVKQAADEIREKIALGKELFPEEEQTNDYQVEPRPESAYPGESF